jgi:signal transduction histidine kinase
MGWATCGATLISLVGILLAIVIARRIARAIGSLVEPALSIGRGKPVTDTGFQPVQETFAVASALVQASELQQRQVETMRQQRQTLEQSEERYRVANRNLQAEIDERQAAQANLADKQRELEEMNHSLGERVAGAVAELRQKDQVMITQSRQAAMGEMIGNIAHQWRQPLNALGLLLANIKDAYHFGDLDEAYLDSAVADGNRLVQKMSVTINDFRNFFNPGKANVVFSARQQVQDAILLVEASLRNDNIQMDLQAPRDLKLFGFPNEYSQVLLNLLTNAKDAIKATGTAGGRVIIGLSECEGQGIVTVSDNGGGIPAQSLDRVFEPYFSTKEMGTGIGLYMSKMIIERNMHGSIEVRNIEGGAEFTIRTPLAREEG